MNFTCPEKLQFGEYSLDPSGSLLHNGQPIKIQPQPLTVLRKLLERPGQLVSREELRALLWGDAAYGEFEQGLNFCIRQIRSALNDNAREPRYIETLPKQGYRFIFPVQLEELESEPHPQNAAEVDDALKKLPDFASRRKISLPWIAAGAAQVFPDGLYYLSRPVEGFETPRLRFYSFVKRRSVDVARA